MTIIRCKWVNTNNALYCRYHDEEWGVIERDSQALFEKLMLDGLQAGLSWLVILKKRENLRKAFHNFSPEKMIYFDDHKRQALLQNPDIIRSKTKINAMISNAHAYLKLKEQGLSFSDWLWSFVDGSPVQNAWKSFDHVPTQTKESEALAKALKEKGFTFCGPVIVYAFMQAVGMVLDHTTDCFRYSQTLQQLSPCLNKV